VAYFYFSRTPFAAAAALAVFYSRVSAPSFCAISHKNSDWTDRPIYLDGQMDMCVARKIAPTNLETAQARFCLVSFFLQKISHHL